MNASATRPERAPVATYLLGALGGFSLVALLCVGSVLLSLNSRVSTGLWTQQRLSIKSEALQRSNPKLALLGGSNVLYGFSAEQLTTQHAVTAINAGTHAGLGLAYILRDGRRYLAPGRVIVLALEYDLYSDGYFDPALADQVLGFEPEMFWGLDIPAQAHLLFGLPLAERVRYLRAALGSEGHRAHADTDARKVVNAWGDAVDNDLSARTPQLLSAVQATRPISYLHSARAWRLIKDFASDAHRSGARLVIAYPTVYHKAVGARNGAFLAELERRAGELGIPTVGRPEDYLFGDEHIFNTRYHQTREGQQISTEKLYRQLAAAGLI